MAITSELAVLVEQLVDKRLGNPGPACTVHVAPVIREIPAQTDFDLWLSLNEGGTLAQYLSSRVGATGPAGAQGIAGSAGPKGDTGTAGPQGNTGPAGASGATGPQGAQGFTGAKGDTGPVGPQGPAGTSGTAVTLYWTARNTSGTGLASDQTLPSKPIPGTLRVIQGVDKAIGDGAKDKDCYFSSNNGSTALSLAAIDFGHKLFWVGANAGYDLDTNDTITIIYRTNT